MGCVVSLLEFLHNQPVKTQIEFTVKPGEARDLGELVIRNVDRAG